MTALLWKLIKHSCLVLTCLRSTYLSYFNKVLIRDVLIYLQIVLGKEKFKLNTLYRSMLAMWQIERKPCNKCTDLNTKRHFTVWYVELTGFHTGETVLKIIYCYGCFLFVFYTDTVHFEGGYKYVFSHSCLLNSAMLSDQNDDSFTLLSWVLFCAFCSWMNKIWCHLLVLSSVFI